ncbi:MAG: hypothetical protein WAN75_25605 [Xanthobacteraceae bacterium]
MHPREIPRHRHCAKALAQALGPDFERVILLAGHSGFTLEAAAQFGWKRAGHFDPVDRDQVAVRQNRFHHTLSGVKPVPVTALRDGYADFATALGDRHVGNSDLRG